MILSQVYMTQTIWPLGILGGIVLKPDGQDRNLFSPSQDCSLCALSMDFFSLLGGYYFVTKTPAAHKVNCKIQPVYT